MRAKRRSAADVSTRCFMVATRTIGWSLSTVQIALLIAGASAAASPCVRTTSDIWLSAQYHFELGMYTAAPSLSSNVPCRTSLKTPTIVDHDGLPPGRQRIQMRRPIGSWLPNFRLANDSLIRATLSGLVM